MTLTTRTYTTRLTDTTQFYNSLSDQSILSFTYKQYDTIIQPLYKIIRDLSKLSKQNQEFAYDNNQFLNEAFQYQDPNQIANILVEEIIQNTMALPKRVQNWSTLAPNKELQSFSPYKEDRHKIAIINNDTDSWRSFKKV